MRPSSELRKFTYRDCCFGLNSDLLLFFGNDDLLALIGSLFETTNLGGDSSIRLNGEAFL